MTTQYPAELKNKFNLDLPKWPQLIIIGDKVSEDQAKEIIYRTDAFLHDIDGFGGNDREFRKAYSEHSNLSSFKTPANVDGREFERYHWDAYYKYKEKVGFLDLEYVYNRFAASSFIYGPAGFCHPDGKIYFSHNVGKWPSVEDVYNDFVKIAQAFPFLNMQAALYSGEEWHDDEDGVKEFVVGFKISNGHVEMTFEDLNLHEKLIPYDTNKAMEHIFSSDYSGERGLPRLWYSEFAKRSRSIIENMDKPVLE